MSLFTFLDKLKETTATAVNTLTSNVYLFSLGTETYRIEGEGLTWLQVALASGQVSKEDKFTLINPSNNNTLNPNDPAQYGIEVRAVKTADSKGLI